MDASIYLFDMDHTLIANDCDVSWKSFMVEKGLAPDDSLTKAEQFFQDYQAGRLDITDFMRFQLAEFEGKTSLEMRQLAQEHFTEYVKHLVYTDAVNRVKEVINRDLPIALITATNEVIAQPVAEYFDIPRVLAVRPEIENNRYTGRFIPPYSGGSGKISLAREFCREHGATLSQTAYFGDSPNDIPLLQSVGFPVAVNPAPELRVTAESRGWPIITWQ